VSRHFISSLLALCACVLLLHAGAPQAQLQRLLGASGLPDPAYYGSQVESGNVAQVREWLDAGLDPNFMADRIGSGLMIAAWNGDIPMMALLVARGADVNKPNDRGERPLMHAAWRGQLEAMEWLLARGARVNGEPMQWSALHYAVFGGRADAAALLLDKGADINARSANGSSVVMMAVYEGHEQLVRQLVARGADLSVKNDRGDGALEWAFKFKHLGIARIVATPEQFVVAANKPVEQWGEAQRSRPVPGKANEAPPPDPAGDKIEELVRMRNILESRGLKEAAAKMDRRIAGLRAQRARAYKDSIPAVVLEISARRAAPEDQKARLIVDPPGPPP
jgi:hypothetical protein